MSGRPRPRISAAGRRHWRGRRAPRAELRDAALWGAAFAVLAGGYGVLAPAVDDWRSGRREMTAACRVERAIDGDTVELGCPDRAGGRARVVGYDAPELSSPRCAAEAEAADRARRMLEALVARAWRVEVAFLGRDRYGRDLVDMRLDGARVATTMVEAGHGRRYFGKLRGGWC